VSSARAGLTFLATTSSGPDHRSRLGPSVSYYFRFRVGRDVRTGRPTPGVPPGGGVWGGPPTPGRGSPPGSPPGTLRLTENGVRGLPRGKTPRTGGKNREKTPGPPKGYVYRGYGSVWGVGGSVSVPYPVPVGAVVRFPLPLTYRRAPRLPPGLPGTPGLGGFRAFGFPSPLT
jgi:hypothetical protein